MKCTMKICKEEVLGREVVSALPLCIILHIFPVSALRLHLFIFKALQFVYVSASIFPLLRNAISFPAVRQTSYKRIIVVTSR